MKWAILTLAMMSAPAAAQTTPLFASDDPIRVTISGPIGAISRQAEDSTQPREATLTVTGSGETHPIRLSARGITRRLKQTCTFPPLRVDIAQPPAATALFAGQRRLKLVTHCRSQEGFQQHLLLEYSAYRIFNLITPQSFRVRLATVDYAEPSGKLVASRWGFFIEDVDDVARRNGTTHARTGDRVLSTQLEPRQAARVALFEYMIGNLDWSIRAGPPGEGCCHNSRLLTGQGKYVAVPYDFDYSGLVDAPYAVPPEGISVKSVRSRFYQGYCRVNNEALAVAAEFRAKRPAIEALYSQIPGISDRTRAKALAYLGEFYAQIATDQSVQAKLLKNCMT